MMADKDELEAILNSNLEQVILKKKLEDSLNENLKDVAKEERRRKEERHRRLLRRSDHLIEDVMRMMESAAASGKTIAQDEIFLPKTVGGGDDTGDKEKGTKKKEKKKKKHKKKKVKKEKKKRHSEAPTYSTSGSIANGVKVEADGEAPSTSKAAISTGSSVVVKRYHRDRQGKRMGLRASKDEKKRKAKVSTWLSSQIDVANAEPPEDVSAGPDIDDGSPSAAFGNNNIAKKPKTENALANKSNTETVPHSFPLRKETSQQSDSSASPSPRINGRDSPKAKGENDALQVDAKEESKDAVVSEPVPASNEPEETKPDKGVKKKEGDGKKKQPKEADLKKKEPNQLRGSTSPGLRPLRGKRLRPGDNSDSEPDLPVAKKPLTSKSAPSMGIKFGKMDKTASMLSTLPVPAVKMPEEGEIVQSDHESDATEYNVIDEETDGEVNDDLAAGIQDISSSEDIALGNRDEAEANRQKKKRLTKRKYRANTARRKKGSASEDSASRGRSNSSGSKSGEGSASGSGSGSESWTSATAPSRSRSRSRTPRGSRSPSPRRQQRPRRTSDSYSRRHSQFYGNRPVMQRREYPPGRPQYSMSPNRDFRGQDFHRFPRDRRYPPPPQQYYNRYSRRPPPPPSFRRGWGGQGFRTGRGMPMFRKDMRQWTLQDDRANEDRYYGRRRRDRDRSYSRSRSRSRSRRRSRRDSRSRRRRSSSRSSSRSSRSNSRSSRSRTRSSERERRRDSRRKQKLMEEHVQTGDTADDTLSKKELFDLAKKNVSAMLQAGTMQQIKEMSMAEIVQIRAGGKTVEELVEHCRVLAEEQAKRDAARGRTDKKNGESSSEDEAPRKRHSSEEKDFTIRHPFSVKPTSAITLNIKNATSVPVKTPQERAQEELKLRISFPVSSGQQHRATEWVPVAGAPLAIEGPPRDDEQLALPAPPTLPDLNTVAPSTMPLAAPDVVAATSDEPLALPAPPAPPPAMNVSDVVTQRIRAIRSLQENPHDVEALKLMKETEERMKKWAESKNQPGAFLGSTGVQNRILKPEELGPANPRYQAWAKKDALTSAVPAEAKLGKTLLEKMGWKPGEGLGKNKAGSLVPLMLDVKVDRKGLSAAGEHRKVARPINLKTATIALQNKHPVSTLMELCSKRRWPPPDFHCEETGNAQFRRYLWRVVVNGTEYVPDVGVTNKKTGKMQAALVALQTIGVLPKDMSKVVVG